MDQKFKLPKCKTCEKELDMKAYFLTSNPGNANCTKCFYKFIKRELEL